MSWVFCILFDLRTIRFLLVAGRGRENRGSPVIAHRTGGMVALADGSSLVSDGPVINFLGLYSG